MKIKNLLFFYILIFAMILIQCGNKPTEPQDTIRPTVISITPANNATDVPITDSVIIRFSEQVGVGMASLSVSNALIDFDVIDSGAIIKFRTPLEYNTVYTITIRNPIVDLSGNDLLDSITSSFTTEIDPATLPPSIVSTYPAIGAEINAVTDSVTVTFSKNIDATTLNDTTFFNTNGITGTISYNSQTKTAIFQPTIPFSYDASYVMSITASVKDTAGSNLLSPLSWLFTTPTITPQAGILSPLDSMIIGDTISFFTAAENPIGIDTVQFYIDNIRVGIGNYTPPSVQYLLDASTFEVGSEHTMYAVAYDSLGNFGYSDTVTFFYLWQLVKTDGNNNFNYLEVPNDLRKMFARSTDTTLELRYEYALPWDSAYWDTTIDLAIFFDTDFSSATGRRTNGGDTINDIGAEYRALIGVVRSGIEDTVVHIWDANCTDTVCWRGYLTFTDIYKLNVPNFSNVIEFGMKWSDLGNPFGVDIVSINVLFKNIDNDPLYIIKDYMPDVDSGHVRIYRDNRYIGPQSITNFKRNLENKSLSTPALQRTPNPFD